MKENATLSFTQSLFHSRRQQRLALDAMFPELKYHQTRLSDNTTLCCPSFTQQSLFKSESEPDQTLLVVAFYRFPSTFTSGTIEKLSHIKTICKRASLLYSATSYITLICFRKYHLETCFKLKIMTICLICDFKSKNLHQAQSIPSLLLKVKKAIRAKLKARYQAF